MMPSSPESPEWHNERTAFWRKQIDVRRAILAEAESSLAVALQTALDHQRLALAKSKALAKDDDE